MVIFFVSVSALVALIFVISSTTLETSAQPRPLTALLRAMTDSPPNPTAAQLAAATPATTTTTTTTLATHAAPASPDPTRGIAAIGATDNEAASAGAAQATGGGEGEGGGAGDGESSGGYGCGAAIAYLEAHANPTYTIECPGYAYGREAMTCSYTAPECPDSSVIAIADPCPAAYMNEAVNSNSGGEQIDPYGDCQDSVNLPGE